MKKAGFSCIPLFILLILFVKSPVFAEDSSNGNVSSSTTVKNEVNNGSVKSRIETTVNGKTSIIDSEDQGEIEVENDNGNITVKKSPNVTVTVSENDTATKTPTPTIKPEEPKKTLISYILDGLSNFFKRILRNL